jgi:cullin-associated NEDD8-dissociated protein 1
LAPLVKKVSEDRVVEMTNKLCDKLLNGKDQHRDTASIALKTIIVEVTTPSLAEKILVSLAPQLISGVTSVSFFYFISCFRDFSLVVRRPLRY